jgi:hypothetical protein
LPSIKVLRDSFEEVAAATGSSRCQSEGAGAKKRGTEERGASVVGDVTFPDPEDRGLPGTIDIPTWAAAPKSKMLNPASTALSVADPSEI